MYESIKKTLSRKDTRFKHFSFERT